MYRPLLDFAQKSEAAHCIWRGAISPVLPPLPIVIPAKQEPTSASATVLASKHFLILGKLYPHERLVQQGHYLGRIRFVVGCFAKHGSTSPVNS